MTRTTQRVQFAGHGGNQLAGIIEFPTEFPRGFLLFSHCFTCNKDLKAIVRISRALADLGWVVMRYDFSGLGNSEGDFSQTNFTSNREDLRAAARFLAHHYQPVDFLIGHSFGGAASMSMVDELPAKGVIALAAPSDTYHLAALLVKMDPDIETLGHGSVTIGGRTYSINKQMVQDFRSFDLGSAVMKMKKPLIVFHSPTDETVDYRHALINCGWETTPVEDLRGLSHRSLVTLPNSNHLLTNNDEDCQLVAKMTDAWCRRIIG